ncbi:MAG: exodeoxyribonuclease VII large subunit, partial [Dehalococcoidia bacterium]
QRALAVLGRAMTSATRETVGARVGLLEGSVARLRRGAPSTSDLVRDVRGLLREMQAGLERRSATDRARFEGVSARLTGLDPHATLGRGFAIVQRADSKKVINSVRKVKPGDRLNISVADGAFWTEVS